MHTFKEYSHKYFDSCLSIFKTNIPIFFASKEEILFCNYLLKKDLYYYILFNKNNKLVASGGFAFNKNSKSIDLTWGMVAFKAHNKGFGTIMTNYRLKEIERIYPKTNITLNTTQKTFEFYMKFGFKLQNITKDYYTIGLHRYDMIKVF